MNVVNVNGPPANPVGLETRHASNQRIIQSLVHACQCCDTDCSLRSCKKMKRILAHIKCCESQSSANCGICEHLMALCHYHGKNCTMRICPVPFCFSIQKTIREKKRLLLELSMTAERRKDVTDLLVEAILSSTHPVVVRMNICDIESYAKRLERKIFNLADTVADYHRILASQKWEIEIGET